MAWAYFITSATNLSTVAIDVSQPINVETGYGYKANRAYESHNGCYSSLVITEVHSYHVNGCMGTILRTIDAARKGEVYGPQKEPLVCVPIEQVESNG